MATTFPPGYTGKEKRWHLFVDRLCSALRGLVGDLKPDNIYWPAEGDYRTLCYEHSEGNRDGGWDGGEEDSQQFCEVCGCILDHCYTDEGTAEEIEYSASDEMLNQPITQQEAFTLLNVIDCGWPRLTERCGDFIHSIEYKPALRRIRKRLDLIN